MVGKRFFGCFFFVGGFPNFGFWKFSIYGFRFQTSSHLGVSEKYSGLLGKMRSIRAKNTSKRENCEDEKQSQVRCVQWSHVIIRSVGGDDDVHASEGRNLVLPQRSVVHTHVTERAPMWPHPMECKMVCLWVRGCCGVGWCIYAHVCLWRSGPWQKSQDDNTRRTIKKNTWSLKKLPPPPLLTRHFSWNN